MENETAETYIANIKSLHLKLRSGIVGTVNDETNMLFRLIKIFEGDGLFTDSIQLAYFTEKDFDQTVEVIIRIREQTISFILILVLSLTVPTIPDLNVKCKLLIFLIYVSAISFSIVCQYMSF